MATTIESLELEIQQSSTSAVGGIQALSQTLQTLKNATKGITGLQRVANGIGAIRDAANGVSAESATRLNALADALRNISQAGRISPSVANQLTNIGNVMQSLNGVSFAPIESLATALSALSGLGQFTLSSSIANQLVNIGVAADTLQGVNFDAFRHLAEALQPLMNLGNFDLRGLVNSLNRIPRLANVFNGVDWGAFTGQIQQMTTALAPLTTQLNTLSEAFNRLPANLRNAVNATNRLSTANRTATTSYVNLWARARMAYNMIAMGSRIIAQWINKSNEYIENVNLFTASLGKYADEAKAYAEQVSELMGIDPAVWMRQQGVFNTITKGFGVATDKAYLMSQQLTQLGYDISSFYNISIEDAMTKLQSGIAGELEPLRRLGYDLSVARLREEALALGIKKKVSAMTQAEKSQLRYVAIMKQVNTSHGDMARTLETPANMLRILKAQFEQLSRALGNLFQPMLQKVLPWLIAIVKVLRELVEGMATLVGFEMPKVDYSGISDVAEQAEGATKQVKELKRTLMSFDEINKLNDNKDSSKSGDGVSGGSFDIDLTPYSYDFLGGLNTRIDEIVKKIKEWLGISQKLTSWADIMHTRLGKIVTIVGAIAAGFLAWKISEGVMSAIKFLVALRNGGNISATLGVGLVVTGLTLEWAAIADAVQKELDTENFAMMIGGALFTTAGAAIIGGHIARWLTTAFSGTAVATAVQTAATNLGVGTASAAGAALGAGVSSIIAGIPLMFYGIWDAITNGLNWLNGILIPTGSALAGAGIGAIIGSLGGPIGMGIGALIGLITGLIVDGVIAIQEHWGEISKWLTDTWNNLKSTAEKVFGSIKSFIQTTWSAITKWTSEKWTSVKTTVLNVWETLKTKAGQAFETIKNTVSTAWTNVKTWTSEKWEAAKKTAFEVWDSLKTKASTIFASVSSFVSTAWTNVKTWTSEKWEAAKKTAFEVWDSLKTKASTIFASVSSFVSTAWTNVKTWTSEKWEAVKSKTTEIWDNLSQNASNTFGNISTHVSEAWGSAQSVLGDFIRWIETTFSGDWGTAWNGIVEGFGRIFDTVTDKMKAPINAVIRLINKMIDAIETAINQVVRGINRKLHINLTWDVPDWVPGIGGDKYGWEWSPNLKEVNWGHVNELAKGAILTMPTMLTPDVLAGEAGREAVLPLDRNTDWMDKVAARVASYVAPGAIYDGGAKADERELELLRQQNHLLQQLLEKDTTVEVTTSSIAQANQRMNRRAGVTVTPVGT